MNITEAQKAQVILLRPPEPEYKHLRSYHAKYRPIVQSTQGKRLNYYA